MKLSLLIACFCMVLGFSHAIPKNRRQGVLNEGLRHRGVDLMTALNADAPEQWYTEQLLDHFDPLNTQTWSQRYFLNATYWRPGGPIFLVLGGEGPISQAYVNGHFVVNEYAQEHNAMVIGVEHRFYGKSVPTGDLATESLKYLSSAQALADYAQFRQFIAKKFDAGNSKWIAFGGSYPGNLSAWIREKYPHLFDGSLAVSAPVLAQLNFPEYNEVVSRSVGPSCSNSIGEAFKQMDEMVETAEGCKQLETMFDACSAIETDLDIANFYENVEGGIAEIVQYNNDNNGAQYNISTMCNMIDGKGLNGLAEYTKFFNKKFGASCTEVSYKDSIRELQDTSTFPDNGNAAARSWIFQTCTEFGYYQTGESSKQPFSSKISLEYYLDMCEDIFGIQGFTPNIAASNTRYGARNFQGTNVAFSNGSIDPWHALGILKTNNPALSAFFMSGTAHCADLYAPSPNDVPDLTKTRVLQKELLRKWLS